MNQKWVHRVRIPMSLFTTQFITYFLMPYLLTITCDIFDYKKIISELIGRILTIDLLFERLIKMFLSLSIFVFGT